MKKRFDWVFYPIRDIRSVKIMKRVRFRPVRDERTISTYFLYRPIVPNGTDLHYVYYYTPFIKGILSYTLADDPICFINIIL